MCQCPHHALLRAILVGHPAEGEPLMGYLYQAIPRTEPAPKDRVPLKDQDKVRKAKNAKTNG